MVDTIINNKLITNILLLCLVATFNNSVFCLLVFVQLYSIIFFYHDATPLESQGLLIVEDTRSHTVRHTTLGRTPLDEWSARRRDLYLSTNNTHKRQTSMRQAGFEPTVLASERPQTHALDRKPNRNGILPLIFINYIMIYYAEEGAFLDVCTVHFVEFYYICPTNAQYMLTIICLL